MGHWMRQERRRGEGPGQSGREGMQPFWDKDTSKMSVVKFEGSVSEAKTCKTTCVFLLYRSDGARGSVHRCFDRTRSWSTTLPRQVLFGCFAMISFGFWRVLSPKMLTVGSSDIWNCVHEPARPLRAKRCRTQVVNPTNFQGASLSVSFCRASDGNA